MTRATWALLGMGLATSACTSPPSGDAGTLDSQSARDAAANDIVDAAPAGPDCGLCGAHFPCPGGHHVDCMAGLACTPAGVPYASVHAPYYTCTAEEADQRRREHICAGFGPWEMGAPCSGGCSVENIEPRYAPCNSPTNRTPGIDWFVRSMCSVRPRVGDACRVEEHCHPAPDEPDFNLRCIDRQCARVPRPEAPPGFGESCGLSEVGLRPGIVSGASPCIVYGAPGCFVQRQTMACLVDEQCPAGWDCAVASPCQGFCLPRGIGRDYQRPPSTCPRDDAGADASDATQTD